MAFLSVRYATFAVLWLAFTAASTRHVGRGASAAVHTEQVRIVPTLSPKSDSHFFGHDYPHDNTPTAPIEKDFSHPYPVVQDTDTYDKDYVKDENGDNGEWKAQQDYDRIRTRLENLKEDAKKILAKKQKLENELADERAKEKDIDDQKDKLEESERKADEEMKAAKDRLKHPRNATYSDTSDSVGLANASDAVRKEVKDIEDCKRRLAEAHAELKALQKELNEAERREESAEDARTAAEKLEAESRSKERAAKGELTRERAEHESALESYNKEKAELATMEKELEQAETRLRTFRGNVDPDGGVYRKDTKERSSASLRDPSLWAVLLVATAWNAAL